MAIITESIEAISKGNIIGVLPEDFYAERNISKSVRVTGTGAIIANVLQFYGTIQIIEQYAVITSITSLINCTNVYADVYDGTNAVDLTLDGADLSGFEVGAFFLKDKVATLPYSSLDADQVRVNEVLDAKKVGRTFIVNAKDGGVTDNYIRFHLTTTDTPIDFTMRVHFTYRRLTTDAILSFL